MVQPIEGAQPAAVVEQEAAPIYEAEDIDVEESDQIHDEPLLPAISWEASEYVHREKNMMWFVGVGVVGLVLALMAFLVLKSITFAILVVVMAFALIFLAMRPPRILRYQITSKGLEINENHYGFHDFRAFGVVQEDAMYYITLLPIKRFSPAVDVYFPQEHGEQIVDMIGSQIPMQVVKPDFVDRLTKYLRF